MITLEKRISNQRPQLPPLKKRKRRANKTKNMQNEGNETCQCVNQQNRKQATKFQKNNKIKCVFEKFCILLSIQAEQKRKEDIKTSMSGIREVTKHSTDIKNKVIINTLCQHI